MIFIIPRLTTHLPFDTMKKLLTVFGATGAQGGSLIEYVLKHPQLSKKYGIRGVTRDTSKPAAIALRDQGVEVVQADMDNKLAVDQAVRGSHAVFFMTNYWDKASAEIEVAQGKRIADSTVAAGSELLIFSSLPNVKKMTDGKLSDVKHFDSKAEVEGYIRTLHIRATFYMPGFYMQNLLHMMKPQLNNDTGAYEFRQPWNPTSTLPLIDITDTGKYLAPVLLDPAKFDQKRLTAATAFYTPAQMVQAWSEITGKRVDFIQVAPGASKSPVMTPEMMEVSKKAKGLIKDWSYYGPTGRDDLEWTLRQIDESEVLTSWEEFVRRNEPWFENV